TRVTGISLAGGRVTGVETERGTIDTEVVVNAAGMATPEVGSMVGVTIPIVPMSHQYLVTEPVDGVTPELPQLRDPDNLVYFRPEVRGLVVGAGFSAHGIAGAGGMGRQMAQWIVAGEPELDLWTMDIRRFGSQYRSRGYTLARTTEVYATYYDIHYPNEERQAGRPL